MGKGMLMALVGRLIEAYAAPRLSARRLLSVRPTPLQSVMMLMAGFAIVSFFEVAMDREAAQTASKPVDLSSETPANDEAAKIAERMKPGDPGHADVSRAV